MNISKFIFFGIFLYFLIYFIPKIYAADFSISVTPQEINASVSTQLTFNVTNLGIENITVVNITLPSNFAFNSCSTQDGNCYNDPPKVVFHNFNITQSASKNLLITLTANAIGNFSFTATTLDSSNITQTNSTNITVYDVTLPSYTFPDPEVSPANNSQYAQNQNYTFNITWTDNIQIDKVWYSWNGSDNQTVSPYEPGKYSFKLTDLSAGVYTYQWYANDTSNNVKTTGPRIYVITKKYNLLNITINGIYSNFITIYNGTSLNINVSSIGTLTIIRNFTGSNSTATASNTFSETILPSIGNYFYYVNTSGNQNYTYNETTIFIKVIYPAPKWSSNTTSIPSSYSSSTYSTFNFTWYDSNDARGFNVSLIEANFTGSFVNYTMSRIPGTNTSTFQIILPAGTFSWRVYANNSFNSFNFTPLFTFTISKSSPPLTLTASPGWNLLPNTPTNVSCTSSVSEITPKLYRNGVEVSNPDIQNFATGEFIYVCNNTATQNYTSSSVSNTLILSQLVANLNITANSFILVEQNSSNSTVVIIKNTGDISQLVNFSIEGINASWYSINSTSKNLLPGLTFPILVTFNVGSEEVKDYYGNFKVIGTNKSINSSFILRVSPGYNKIIEINNSLKVYQAEAIKLEQEINELKQRLNISYIEANYSILKAKIYELENYFKNKNYFEAYQKSKEVNELLESIKSSLSATQPSITQLPEQIAKAIGPSLYYILIGVGAAAGIFIYLLWPTKGYVPQQYKKTSQFVNQIKKIKDYIKKLFKKEKGKELVLSPRENNIQKENA